MALSDKTQIRKKCRVTKVTLPFFRICFASRLPGGGHDPCQRARITKTQYESHVATAHYVLEMVDCWQSTKERKSPLSLMSPPPVSDANESELSNF